MDQTSHAEAVATLRSYFLQGRERLYQKGEVVLEGDVKSEQVAFIESGFVKAYGIGCGGNCELITMHGADELIPLTNVLMQDENPLYYEAMTDVAVHTMTKSVFEADLQANPELSMATLQQSVLLLRDVTKRVQTLEIQDSRKRIVTRLLFLLSRFGASSKNAREVLFAPLNYQDLADALNLTRETVNRVVRQMVQEGLVAKTRGRLIILNKSRLMQEVAY